MTGKKPTKCPNCKGKVETWDSKWMCIDCGYSSDDMTPRESVKAKHKDIKGSKSMPGSPTKPSAPKGLKQEIEKLRRCVGWSVEDVLTALDKTIAESKEWDCYCRSCNSAAKEECFKEHPDYIVIYWVDVLKALDSERKVGAEI